MKVLADTVYALCRAFLMCIATGGEDPQIGLVKRKVAEQEA
jgi:GH24 family phage-related lysozyme (muramidase)